MNRVTARGIISYGRYIGHIFNFGRIHAGTRARRAAERPVKDRNANTHRMLIAPSVGLVEFDIGAATTFPVVSQSDGIAESPRTGMCCSGAQQTEAERGHAGCERDQELRSPY